MSLSLIGRKIGMTQTFSERGEVLLPITLIAVTPNVVSAIRTKEINGYEGLQLAFEDCKSAALTKPELGHLSKNKIPPKKFLSESRVQSNYQIGDSLDLNIFREGEKVKVTGTSKGKGFSGVIKRHHHSRGPMAHGSGYHRGVGSMGSIAPNRVFKGKKLPGRMGNQRVTIRGLSIFQIIPEKNLVLIKGCVPGPNNGLVTISKIN